MVEILSNSKLEVFCRERKVGTLMMSPNNTVVVFHYDSDWLANGFSISPLDLPLENKTFVAPSAPFYGNFGIFEDSMPDGYGRYLLHKILQQQAVNDFSLNPLQRLSIVGKSGMGALWYQPETRMGNFVPQLSLAQLQQSALEVLSEKTTEGLELLYLSSGNSGGCRPKCLLKDSAGEWLVKFRHIYDPKDIGITEYQYMALAKRCGVDVPECKLIDGKYFASRRFDIASDGRRLHIATAAALLSESINPPKADYRQLLSLTGYLTQSASQVEQMYRRMVFNVLIDNKDDHAKNFSFIANEDGTWQLAPAYDLLPFPEGYHGQHATSIMYKGNPTDDDMLTAGETIRINRRRGKQIIEEIRTILGDYTK